MERGHISMATGQLPVTTDLPANDESWVEISAAALAGTVAIGLSSASAIMWVFADSSSDADDAYAAGNHGSYRGTDINYEIPCAGRGPGKPNLYIRALTDGSAVTNGLSHWVINGREG